LEGGDSLGAAGAGDQGCAGASGGEFGGTEEPRVVLRDPEGLLFSNEVISSVFAEMERRVEKILVAK
jgi:hypothetical protein